MELLCGNIAFGYGILEEALVDICSSLKASSFFLLTDSGVPTCWTELFESCLQKTSSIPLYTFTIPMGEANKSREQKALIEDKMLELQLDNDCCLIAFGGGVVCDMGGFVAATFKRGIKYVNVPTTLLAMADASLGGKVAVNTKHGKNTIGAFHRASWTCIDLQFLRTLQKRHISNGFCEIIKIAAVMDKHLFEKIEQFTFTTPADKTFKEIVRAAIEIKVRVTTEDFLEQNGNRILLNFGHTFGHALEYSWTDEMLHGEAVSIGMIKEALIARRLGKLDDFSIQRLMICLKSFDLPVDFPTNYDTSRMLPFLKNDKKARNGNLNFVLLNGLGIASVEAIEASVYESIICPFYRVSLKSIKQNVSVCMPGSKSITNRALILACLSSSPCLLSNVSLSEDSLVLMVALQQLGLCIIKFLENSSILVTPIRKEFTGNLTIDVKDCGTAARFLLTLCCSLQIKSSVILTGSERMKERPMKDLVDCLISAGARIEYKGKKGCLPIEVLGSERLDFSFLHLNASMSSQFVSSILLSSVLFKSNSVLYLKGQLTSVPFIEMTVKMMKEFGSNIKFIDAKIEIESHASYSNPPMYHIESDASSVAFILSFAALNSISVRIENFKISSSLQGDSKYADVLVSMGSTYTEHENYLEFDGKISNPISADMNSMTDCFLPLSVISPPGTEIRNIANQRVKESDRIAAMRDNLEEFGIETVEFDDGLKIISSRNVPYVPVIRSYNDHRIVMSFALLAKKQELFIQNPHCASKSWIGFWNTLVERFAFDLEPCFLTDTGSKNSSIVLIGMRNSGKTFLASNVEGRNFIDMDVVFEESQKMPIASFIDTFGWKKFREIEACLFVETFEKNPDNAIIATGGGIIETAKRYLNHLKKQIKIIQVIGNFDCYEKPSFQESFDDVYERRKPIYKECSSFDFYNTKCNNFNQFLRNLDFKDVECRRFLCYGESNLSFLNEHFEVLTYGVDAVEIRIDKLKDFDKSMISHLVSCKSLPFIFTYRKSANYEAILMEGLRLGVQFIDLDYQCPLSTRQRIYRIKSKTKIILSYHGSKLPDFTNMLHELKNGDVDYVKIVLEGDDICELLSKFALILHENFELKTKISLLIAGNNGKISRIMNNVLNPVTHALLNPTAPGQLSIIEINKMKKAIGLLQPKKFYLVGKDIKKSPSPALHNRGFQLYGLPFTYHLHEIDSLDEFKNFLIDPFFGGASITMPFKTEIIPFLDFVDPTAKEIGAVNTIIAQNGCIKGYNTDWIGIKTAIESFKVPLRSALVLGSGGSSKAAVFALKSLNFPSIFVWNRRAEDSSLIKDYNVFNDIDVVISCLPPDAEIPAFTFQFKCLIDLSYIRGGKSKLIDFYKEMCLHYDGLDVLLWQAIPQFELFCYHRAPKDAMNEVIMEFK